MTDPYYDTPEVAATRKFGLALVEISEKQGFILLMEALEKKADEVGRLALRDKERTLDYYRGQLDMLEGLRNEIRTVMEQARSLRQQEEEHGREIAALFSSSGGSLG